MSDLRTIDCILLLGSAGHILSRHLFLCRATFSRGDVLYTLSVQGHGGLLGLLLLLQGEAHLSAAGGKLWGWHYLRVLRQNALIQCWNGEFMEMASCIQEWNTGSSFLSFSNTTIAHYGRENGCVLLCLF
jgi:hypothetical protein